MNIGRTFFPLLVVLIVFVVGLTFIEFDPGMITTEDKNAKNFKRERPGIAGCLLVLEDRILLREWLAYHSTVLPLSSVIIALDLMDPPQHVAFTKALAEKYRRMGINVTIWTNDTWMEPATREKCNPELHTKQYPMRQCHFATQCTREHKRNNATWVLLTDTDEFLIFNSIHNDEDPDSYEQIVLAMHPKEETVKQRNETRSIRARLPSIRNTTVLDYLQDYPDLDRCIRLVGNGFSDINSTREELHHGLSKQVMSTGVNISRIISMNHRTHTPRLSGFSKIMMDVSRVNASEMDDRFCNTIHNANRRVCGHNRPSASGKDYQTAILRVQHYIGGLEVYQERSMDNLHQDYDTRRNKNVAFKVTEPLTDDDIRPWLNNFVDEVGPSKAKELLTYDG